MRYSHPLIVVDISMLTVLGSFDNDWYWHYDCIYKHGIL